VDNHSGNEPVIDLCIVLFIALSCSEFGSFVHSTRHKPMVHLVAIVCFGQYVTFRVKRTNFSTEVCCTKKMHFGYVKCHAPKGTLHSDDV